VSQVAIENLAQLTPREREVMDLLVVGHPNKIIGHKLEISPRTVEVHRGRVMEKMAARSLSDLVRAALAAGLDIGV
jgi:two-component system response regulator FixJ